MKALFFIPALVTLICVGLVLLGKEGRSWIWSRAMPFVGVFLMVLFLCFLAGMWVYHFGAIRTL